MVTIEIDEEVYSYLSKRAIAFVDNTPNDVLRRFLKLNDPHIKSKSTKLRAVKRRKKPKTSLSDLVQVGLLDNGQELYLHDYQGNKIDGYSAKLQNGFLIFNGKYFSMSDLAMQLLKENGFQSNSVRGPLFWYTQSGKSIKKLWDIYLDNHYE